MLKQPLVVLTSNSLRLYLSDEVSPDLTKDQLDQVIDDWFDDLKSRSIERMNTVKQRKRKVNS